MLRQLQTVNRKNADAMLTAGEAMKVGMMVIKDLANGEVVLPSAATSSNVFFVTKEKIPTGLLSVQGEQSEYLTDFNDIAEDEEVVLITPVAGERYATDQFTAANLQVGYPVHVGTDGKIFRIWEGTSTMLYGGSYDDNGHTLAKIDIIEATAFTDPRSTAALVTAFTFDGQVGDTVITDVAGTVAVTVPYGTDVTDLVADFTLSAGATAKVTTTAQISGATPNNFTSDVIYVVTAEDTETTKNWTVTVTIADPSDEAEITAFSLEEQTGEATINATAGTITIEVANGTAVIALIAGFELSVGATAAVDATPQVSGTTANDFTNPVVYVVTAQNGATTKNWTVTVTEAAE